MVVLLPLLHGIALTLVALLTVPAAVLCAECLAAVLLNRGSRRANRAAPPADAPRPRVAILIPGHDEERGLPATLGALRPQVRAGDRVVVVADNCADGTAAVARDVAVTFPGLDVLVRDDPDRRGKGYALDHGVRHLFASDPPDVLIVVDADCRVTPGAIDALARQVAATGRPAQGVYLLDGSQPPRGAQAVSMLAFTVKNLVRPTGLDNLGLPCLPTGTGMAFPWHEVGRVRLASGNIVEDMHLGVQLAINGAAPRLCREAVVTGPLPPNRAAARQQRVRWEHGHLRTLVTCVPQLLWHGVTRVKPDAVALAMELAVPPLSLLALSMVATLVFATVVGQLGGGWLAARAMLVVLVVSAACVGAAWFAFVRQTVPLRTLLATPFYVIGKIPLYWAFLFKPQKEWVRTERAAEKVEPPTVPPTPDPEKKPQPALSER